MRRYFFPLNRITAQWTLEKGWEAPEIKPYAPLVLEPSALVFHYASECFEGMKAYKDKQGKIRLFRPDMNMARMNRSTARIALPVCLYLFLWSPKYTQAFNKRM